MSINTKNIFLIGFMATGKSHIGSLLSNRLGYGIMETDEEIVKQEGKTINDIFAQDGEQTFRDMETQLLTSLKRDEISNFVISCGGGMVLRTENAALMKEMGCIILLSATVDEILRRTANDRSRPLLQTKDKRARVEDMLADRGPIYAQAADISIATTDLTPEEVVDEIIKKMKD